jgi:hypothetical protein
MLAQFTGSFNITGSILLNGVPVTASGNIIFDSSSFMITGSAVGNTLTFTKGDNSTFDMVFESGSGAADTNIQTFLTSSTWYKPANAKVIRVDLVGGGGGAGSGRRGASATNRCGGGGGAAGAYAFAYFNADQIPATMSIVVGTGGAGGAAVTANDTNGNSGATGSFTYFGDSSYAILYARGGASGGAGVTTVGPGGTMTQTTRMFMPTQYQNGGSGAVTNGSTASPQPGWPKGGGGGAGIPVGNTVGNGGVGNPRVTNWAVYPGYTPNSGSSAGVRDGGNGDTVNFVYGNGGGGGASALADVGGNGGNGGFPGGGGGGGSASENGFNSGVGGTGANGVAVITTYF